MLCWVYYKGKNGPLFDYRATGKAGVHLWVIDGKLYVYFRSRGYLDTPHLWHTVLAGGWKFVGASYDHSTGDANLWVNGAVVYTRNIGIGLDLAINLAISLLQGKDRSDAGIRQSLNSGTNASDTTTN